MELYVEGVSWLHRLDPRAKMVLTVAGTVLLLLIDNIWMILSVLVATHLVLLSAGVPASRFRWAWQVMLPVLVLVPLLWPLFYREGTAVLLAVGPIEITLLSLVRGLAVALRISALGFIWFVTLFSTDQSHLVLGMVQLGLPFAWGLAVAIALRYLPVLQGTYATVSEAQQARGLVIGRGNVLQRAQAQLPILVAMMIGAIRTANHLSLALQARAYDSRRSRTNYHELRFSPVDQAIIVLVIILSIAVVFGRFTAGFGAHPLDLMQQ